MQLKQIDKARYSTHFKWVFVGVILLMLGVSLSVSTLLIQLFTDGQGSHLVLNVVGVVVAALVVGGVFRRYRKDAFLYEVMYVWDLKQMLNRIYRKQRVLKAAMAEGDRRAMVIMNFSYQGSKQLYELDNNTITMEELDKAIAELATLQQQYAVTLSLDEFDVALLDAY